ncbi:hypothetical protein [Burkholderia sp. BCC1993]|uniref:hypothetical protein n=1 Tax=Burkholderia sp. BCC1993 TaxID=2817444 RepID=UPI002AB2EA24|nr:hypothetical protein [Burkholderia sp. BCC1993]
MTDDRIFDLAYSFAAAFECDEAHRRIVDGAVGEALGQMFEPGKLSDTAALADSMRWHERNIWKMSSHEKNVYRTAFFGALAICRAADPEKESR